MCDDDEGDDDEEEADVVADDDDDDDVDDVVDDKLGHMLMRAFLDVLVSFCQHNNTTKFALSCPLCKQARSN